MRLPLQENEDWAFKIYFARLIFKQKSLQKLICRLFLKLEAVWTGLEPATPCVTGMYSNQLNYQTNTL